MAQIEYASQRQEVWNWYWRTWRRGIWKIHLVLFTVLSTSFFVLIDAPANAIARAVFSAALATTVIAFMAIYPQLRFKPQVRTILLESDGLRTTIGKKTGTRSWRDLKAIDEEDGFLIITAKSGNAFIIPPRAFATPEARADFVSFARASLAAGTSGAA